jgi:PPM family protein phosphatase
MREIKFSCESNELKWSALSDLGRFRANNEDAFLILDFDNNGVRYQGKKGESDLNNKNLIFAVSDGMGGAKSGEIASKIAIEKITQLLPRNYGRGMEFADVMKELFFSIHSSMLKLHHSYDECRGMGATLSLCWFTPDEMYFGHVGDSRIYHLPNGGEMKQLTRDHSYVGSLFRAGKINEREARNHPMSNILDQVLGGGNGKIHPQIEKIAYKKGDRFLICSDGLTDGLWDHKIEKYLGFNQTTAKEMVMESVSESGRDNTTAILIEVIS